MINEKDRDEIDKAITKVGISLLRLMMTLGMVTFITIFMIGVGIYFNTKVIFLAGVGLAVAFVVFCALEMVDIWNASLKNGIHEAYIEGQKNPTRNIAHIHLDALLPKEARKKVAEEIFKDIDELERVALSYPAENKQYKALKKKYGVKT